MIKGLIVTLFCFVFFVVSLQLTSFIKCTPQILNELTLPAVLRNFPFYAEQNVLLIHFLEGTTTLLDVCLSVFY